MSSLVLIGPAVRPAIGNPDKHKAFYYVDALLIFSVYCYHCLDVLLTILDLLLIENKQYRVVPVI